MPEEKSPFPSLEKIKQEFQEQAAKEKKAGFPETPKKNQEILESVIEKYKVSAPPSSWPPDHEIDNYERMLHKEPHEEQIKKLVEIAKEKGVFAAYKIAERLYKNKPHYIDDFHAALTHYFKT